MLTPTRGNLEHVHTSGDEEADTSNSEPNGAVVYATEPPKDWWTYVVRHTHPWGSLTNKCQTNQ